MAWSSAGVRRFSQAYAVPLLVVEADTVGRNGSRRAAGNTGDPISGIPLILLKRSVLAVPDSKWIEPPKFFQHFGILPSLGHDALKSTDADRDSNTK